MQKSKQHQRKALKALGEAVRNRRLELRLTQEELAFEVELHRTYITDIEGGLRNLSFLTLLRLVRGLNYSLTALMDDAESMDGFYN